MTRPASRYPTELELEILKILWRHDGATVREVRDALAAKRDLAYTSVMTTMGIMRDKKYVARRRKGNGYVYRPRITRDWTAQQMLADVVDRLFEGSASAAMVHLLESNEIDEAELSRLRAVIDGQEEDAS